MKRIAIIGAGWLGLPLAKHLHQLGHWVCASRTTDAGVSKIQTEGISGFICNLNAPETLVKSLSEFRCDTVVGCFPPGFRRGQGDEYVAQWQALVQQAKLANVKKLVMISSTTVYPERSGDMTEAEATLSLATNNNEFSTNANRMLQAEQHVIDSGLDYVIVRCSGLIGPDRHPARFASKLKQVSRLAPANMLHLNDAVGAAAFAVENLNHEIVNATTPATVSKAEFYQAALNAVNSNDELPPIVDITDKKIIGDKLVKLGYQYQFSHTLEALEGDE